MSKEPTADRIKKNTKPAGKKTRQDSVSDKKIPKKNSKTTTKTPTKAGKKTSLVKKQKEVVILEDRMSIVISFQALQQSCALFRLFQGKRIRINGFRAGKEPWILIYQQARDQINRQAVYGELTNQLNKNHKNRELKEMDFYTTGPGKKQGQAFIAEVLYKYTNKTVKTQD